MKNKQKKLNETSFEIIKDENAMTISGGQVAGFDCGTRTSTNHLGNNWDWEDEWCCSIDSKTTTKTNS